MSLISIKRNTLRWFRILLHGGLLSYRALFAWLSPTIYVTTMVVTPILQIVFFSYVGKSLGVSDVSFFVVGNALQICAMSCVYGVVMTIANERLSGTLLVILGTPASRTAIFVGRSLPNVANGILTVLMGFLIGELIFKVNMFRVSMLGLLLIISVTVFSTSGVGMVVGSLGLYFGRELHFLANFAFFILLALCGVNFPVSYLPSLLQNVSHSLPLTRGIMAARELLAGASLEQITPLLIEEFVVGVIYLGVGFVFFRIFEFMGKRRGALEEI